MKWNQENAETVLNELVSRPGYAAAMKKIAASERTFFVWVQRSMLAEQDGTDDYTVSWPKEDDTDSPPAVYFHRAVLLARKMHILTLESNARDAIDRGTERLVIEGGKIVYEQDHELIGKFEGDAEAARALGYHDPFYLHDENGARVPLVVRDVAAASLRIQGLRALVPSWNVAERREVDTKVNGAVLVLGGVAPPNALAPPKTPLQEDLERRLAELRAKGPANPRPDGPVKGVFTHDGDPPDRVAGEPAEPLKLAAPQPPYARQQREPDPATLNGGGYRVA